jgi:hypothetical protein
MCAPACLRDLSNMGNVGCVAALIRSKLVNRR